jgi:hypothetical protein
LGLFPKPKRIKVVVRVSAGGSPITTERVPQPYGFQGAKVDSSSPYPLPAIPQIPHDLLAHPISELLTLLHPSLNPFPSVTYLDIDRIVIT